MKFRSKMSPVSIRLAIVPPITDPASPSPSVHSRPIFCLPGSSSRARRPMMSPAMMNPIMLPHTPRRGAGYAISVVAAAAGVVARAGVPARPAAAAAPAASLAGRVAVDLGLRLDLQLGLGLDIRSGVVVSLGALA